MAVAYFCFIESSILTIPHMEPLAAVSPDEAQEEAQILLSRHGSGIAAHVFEGDTRILTVRPVGIPA